jgi:hypothetical protein
MPFCSIQVILICLCRFSIVQLVVLIVNGIIFSSDRISFEDKLKYGIAMIALVGLNVLFLAYRLCKQLLLVCRKSCNKGFKVKVQSRPMAATVTAAELPRIDPFAQTNKSLNLTGTMDGHIIRGSMTIPRPSGAKSSVSGEGE